MTQTTRQPAFKLVYETGKKIETERFLFACRGNFNSSITDNILFLTEGNLLELDTPKVAKKVYYLMVEGLQNITRHQYYDKSGSPFEGGLFILNRREDVYSITYGNWVSAEVKDQLSERLDTIVSKDSAELKEYYMEILNNSGFSTKGGAGLGLVDMARKSSGKLSFEFSPANEGYFYYLNLIIAIDKNTFDESAPRTNIKDAMKLHKDMLECDAQIVFKGLLHESNVNHLSNHIDTTLSDEEDNGLGSVMTELLRNVAKHAYSKFSESGKPGVFMLQKDEQGFSMLTGNFIHEGRREAVERSVEAINQLSKDEVTSFINRISNDGKGTGLMRLRSISGHSIEYEIKEINAEPPYFILKIHLKG